MNKRAEHPAASSHKLFPILLMVGWIVGCAAVVYFVFIFPWKRGMLGRD
ncbi:sarcoplasmic/endoplasmic reticulum calcium ATPase regulator DWORF-like [Echeneis naucrates]|nr:DWARF open reading frame [Echeneis naucrates]